MRRGIITVGKGRKEEVREVIKRYLRLEVYIKTVKAIDERLVVKLHAMENKIEIMKRKRNLRAVGIWTEDDLTESEKQVQG